MGDKAHDPDKERIFVRALEGSYALKDELKRLRDVPRVRKGKDLKLDGGPQNFSRHYMEPEDGMTQTLHIHLEEYAPGGKTGSTAMSTKRRSTSLMARVTRFTTASATTGRPATSPSFTTIASTSTST